MNLKFPSGKEKKEVNLSRKLSNVLIAILFIGGFCILAYPTFSQFYNKQLTKKVVSDYQNQLETFSESQYDTMFQEAELFNSRLMGRASESFDTVAYQNCMNLGNGMMGYIEIPTIDVSLPIYHGTTESVLQKGVGHLEWSTLPTGELGNNSVLTGHTGLPSATLFTNVDQLILEDVIQLKILDQTFFYEVSNITVVEPHEVDKISSVSNKDLITLVTCTPYGVNSHRLLVEAERMYISDYEATQYSFGEKNLLMRVLEVVLVLTFVVMIVWFYRYKTRPYIPPPIEIDGDEDEEDFE
ncbi:MAG: class C sortase [Eubacteriales bacterium]